MVKVVSLNYGHQPNLRTITMTLKLARYSRATHFLGLALSACLVTVSLNAQTDPTTPTTPTATESIPRFAIGAEVGTIGFGPVVVFTASKNFTANLGYSWLNYDYDFSDDDGDYQAKLKFSNIQAIANWHPFAGSFHLSAGVFLTDNKVDATALPKAGSLYEIGDTTYTAAQVGTVSGTTELSNGAAPFVGLGWSKAPGKSGFGFFFDVGLIFAKAPQTKLTATGPIGSNATFQAELRKEEQSVNDELDPLKHYPIVKFGVLYRF